MREGDFSITRAFQRSGVEATVSSLWEVDDAVIEVDGRFTRIGSMARRCQRS